MFAADRDRERAAAALRQHYVGGRLTLDELSTRLGRVFTARYREELRAALSGLPVFPDAGQIATQVRSVARTAWRGALLVVFTAAYVVFSFVLLLALGLTLLIQGASLSILLGFLVVWLVPTYLLTRHWHGNKPKRRPEEGR